MISAEFPYEKQRIPLFGNQMAYVDVGRGDPIVLLHGNPTSSYLWRNIIRSLEPLGRCIAPDLIGMGESAKLPHSGPGSDRFVEHRRYLDALLDALDVRERVTLVVHDWGSALGFDWANRHRNAVTGIAYFEALVRPISWDEFAEDQRGFFQALRSPAGEAMVLEQNLFLEQLLPGGTLRTLSEEEMTAYRRPFAMPGEGRRPILTFARQLPVNAEPADVDEIVGDYAAWLSRSRIPKLFINGDPGFILVEERRDFCRTWPNQTEVSVRGRHFLQEDSPDQIARAVAEWLPTIRERQAA